MPHEETIKRVHAAFNGSSSRSNVLVWCYAYRPYISHFRPFHLPYFFLDFKMIRSLCFATAVALLASPTGLAFKFKDDGEVDEAATFFGEDSDSTLAAEPAAPREERKIETKVTQKNVEAKLKGDAEPTIAAAASAEGEKAEGRFFDIKGKLCALGLSSDVSFH